MINKLGLMVTSPVFLSGGFQPANITTTSLSVRFVARESDVAVSGGSVTGWNDISGNDNHVTSGTATWNSTGLNELPSVIFNGTSDYLEIAESASTKISTSMSFYVVGFMDNYVDNQHRCWFTKGNHGAVLNYYFGKSNNVGSNNQQQFVWWNFNFAGSLDSTLWRGVNSLPYVLCYVADRENSQFRFYANGSLISTNSATLDYTSSSTVGSRIGAANTTPASYFLDGGISELILDRAAHSTATVLANSTALANSWGITL